eukprot:12458536-Heterocapsa_arctica.AAC.1
MRKALAHGRPERPPARPTTGRALLALAGPWPDLTWPPTVLASMKPLVLLGSPSGRSRVGSAWMLALSPTLAR